MAINRSVPSTKLAKVSFHLGGGRYVQRYVQSEEAHQVELQLMSELVSTGSYRQDVWQSSSGSAMCLRALFRQDGSPVNIIWQRKSQGRSAAVIAVIWEPGSRSKRCRYVSVIEREDMPGAYRRAIEFVIAEQGLSAVHKSKLEGAYSSFVDRYDLDRLGTFN